MSIKKQFLKSKPVCKVTFKLPKNLANGAGSVFLAGDFNNWNPEANPMKGLKSGDFTATLSLESGNEYQFRYLVDGSVWQNDPEADKYVASPYDSQNGVLVV